MKPILRFFKALRTRYKMRALTGANDNVKNLKSPYGRIPHPFAEEIIGYPISRPRQHRPF